MSKRKHITAMWGVTKPHFEGLQRIAQKVPQLFAKKRIFEFHICSLIISLKFSITRTVSEHFRAFFYLLMRIILFD